MSCSVGALHCAAGGIGPPDCIEAKDSSVRACSAVNLDDDVVPSCVTKVLLCEAGVIMSEKSGETVGVWY